MISLLFTNMYIRDDKTHLIVQLVCFFVVSDDDHVQVVDVVEREE